MATTNAANIAIARRHLNEPTQVTNGRWTDAELAALMNLASKDLWRAINDNYQHYFLTIEAALVSQAASATSLTGVPADVGIVRGLEPADLTARPGLVYEYRDYNHIDFARARAMDVQDPSNALKILYCLTGAGSPVAAPTIQVSPRINAAVTLRLSYVPPPATLVASGAAAGETNNNPIPGESDNAIIAWAVAYALAKDNEETRAPNPAWLDLYESEKTKLLVSLAPRQTDDDQVAEAMFEDQW